MPLAYTIVETKSLVCIGGVQAAPKLTIHKIQIHIAPEILAAIETELTMDGLPGGDFSIGGITSSDELYFMWHLPGQAPFSMMLTRLDIATTANARASAAGFMQKWKQR